MDVKVHIINEEALADRGVAVLVCLHVEFYFIWSQLAAVVNEDLLLVSYNAAEMPVFFKFELAQ